MHPRSVLLVLMLTLCTVELTGQHSLREGALSLNGTWECALGTGAERAWTRQGEAGLEWHATTVPGNNLDATGADINKIEFAWARRDFTLTAQQAQQLAILYWDFVTLGASVYINGQFVGHNEPVGPYQVIIPQGVLRAGKNQIVMKVTGYAGVAKGASGKPLIPTGQLIAWGGLREPGIREDIWIDFAHTAYMKWILAIPDLANSRVTIRVTPDGLSTAGNLSLDVTVRTWQGGQLFSQASGPVADLVPDADPLGGTHSYLEVPMAGFRAWTHHTPGDLCTAEVQLRQGDRILDSATIRFGMREVEVENGDWKMNGKTLRLRGTSTSNPNWGRPSLLQIHRGIDDYKADNVNAIRTHCLPPPRIFADAYDEKGLLVLPEFPVTYNHQNFRFTPAEYAIFHQNCLRDAAGWVSRLWNHPSAVMWVLSNESRYDNAWERGPFRDFVLALDPTRPTILAGASFGGANGSDDNFDVHSLGPAQPEGQEIYGAASWQKTAGPARTCSNTEYMNYAGRKWRWTGDDDPDSISSSTVQLGSEITEGMRRNRLDCILWYGSFGPSPGFRSFLSPVLASLDLFSPNYRTGDRITTDVYLINDSWSRTDLHVDIILTSSDPEFAHDSPAFSDPVAQWSYDVTVPADTVTPMPVTWEAPSAPGSYWLAARATGPGIVGDPVVSQRFLHVVEPAPIAVALTEKTFVILGVDAKAVAFFGEKGLATSSDTSSLDPDGDMVIIWNPANLTPEERRSAAALCSFADAGGHVVVLSTASWDWSPLCDVQIGTRSSSRAFLYQGASHPMLEGIEPEFFTRWNCVRRRGLVAGNDLGNLAGANKILWVYEPEDTVVAEVPAATGGGMVLFSQLDIRDRLANTDAEYDPVAERILVNILRMLD